MPRLRVLFRIMASWDALEILGISQARNNEIFPPPSSSFKEAFSKCSGFVTSSLIGVINLQISKEMDPTFFFKMKLGHIRPFSYKHTACFECVSPFVTASPASSSLLLGI